MEAVSNSFHHRTMSSFLLHLRGAKQMITGDQRVDIHSGLTTDPPAKKSSGLTRFLGVMIRMI